MKKKRIALISATALFACGMLTSCDYSNFSLFGFFYNFYVDGLKKSTPTSEQSDDSTNSSSSEGEVVTKGPETYLVTSSKDVDGGKIVGYDMLVLLNDEKAALNSYTRFISADEQNTYTVTSFGTLTDYTRSGNVITLGFGPMAYTDRTDTSNVQFYRGDDESGSKEVFTKAFSSDSPVFTVKADGSFSLGDSATEGEANATGRNDLQTYWYSDFSARPSYFMLTLGNDNTYYLNATTMDSKNDKVLTCIFTASGTYKTYADQSTEEYDAVRINKGRGHDFVNNNGSNMEFDMTSDDTFDGWLSLTVGKVPAYKVTKVGFEGLLGDVPAYGFEAFDKDIGTDDVTPVDPDPTEGAMLVVDGEKNNAIKLAFFSDGTYHFVWQANKIDETGTWSYDKDGDSITLSADKSDGTARVNIISKQEDGTYKVDYISAISEQLTQSFVLSEADFNSYFKVTTILELKGDKKDTITLTFKSDGTYTFAFTDYNVTEDGTWSYDASTDTLSMKVGDKECATITKNGVYDIYYVYSQSSQLDQHYTLTKDEWGKTFVHNLATLTGDKKDTITLAINSDKSYTFSFTDYNVSETGTWSVDSSTGLVSMKIGDKECLTVTKNDGYYDLYYVYSQSSQLDQHYTLDENTYKELFSISDLTLLGQKNTAITLTFNRDHSYVFSFTTYNASETGKWEYDVENDKIVLTCKNTTNELTKQEDGTYTGNYISNMNSGLTQEYILASTDLAALGTDELVNIDKTNTSGMHFGLIFNSNKSYEFHFYNYNVEETGSWTYNSDEDKFYFYCYNTVNSSTKNEDGSYTISYVSHRSSQMTQEYTLTAENAAKLK